MSRSSPAAAAAAAAMLLLLPLLLNRDLKPQRLPSAYSCTKVGSLIVYFFCVGLRPFRAGAAAVASVTAAAAAHLRCTYTRDLLLLFEQSSALLFSFTLFVLLSLQMGLLTQGIRVAGTVVLLATAAAGGAAVACGCVCAYCRLRQYARTKEQKNCY